MFKGILAGVILTGLISPFMIRLACRVGLLDHPGVQSHKQHTKPIPLAGGLVILLVLLVLFFAFGLGKMSLIGVFWPALIIFAFGLWDDFKRLSALQKLIGQVLGAMAVVLSGVSIQVFENSAFYIGGSPLIYVWLDRFLTVFWLVGVTNAFNLVDSMDGLALGLSGWALAFFMLVTYDSNQIALSMLTALLLGICLGLYFFNAPPAHLFLGDSGAQLLGFLLAVIAILYNPLDRYQASSWFLPILLVGVPIFDTSLVFFSRLRRGKPVYQAGRDHTYHRLVALGIGTERAVQLMHLAALVLSCIAFIALGLPPLPANLLFATCLLFAVLAFYYLDHSQRWQ
jgi:UDP-GlcNAc:undecaprenyl-phosphate GlcNAc-1-phosphate transferase